METLLIIAVVAIAISLVVFMMRCVNSFLDTIPGTTLSQKRSNLRDHHIMLFAPRMFGIFAVHCVLLAAAFLVSTFLA